MKILLTGKNGQVGWELNRTLSPLGEVIALDRSDADLSKPEQLRTVVQNIKPDVIVNAAAYTAVDKAENEEELATVINADSPGVLAEEARDLGALFVHYSTDYVFDGTKDSPYIEEDRPNPINAYGRSKLKGEEAIQEVGSDYLILRTSWIYASRGSNFLQTILRLAQEKDELRIVADQIGAPTWARFIAETSALCIYKYIKEQSQGTFNSGIYHLTCSGKASWFDFANTIVENSRSLLPNKKQVVSITPIDSVEYPTPAERPKYSCLASEKLKNHFNVTTPNWKDALTLCMEGIQ